MKKIILHQNLLKSTQFNRSRFHCFRYNLRNFAWVYQIRYKKLPPPPCCNKFQPLLGDEPDFVVAVEEPEWTVIAGCVGELWVVFTGVSNGLSQFNSFLYPVLYLPHISTKRSTISNQTINKILHYIFISNNNSWMPLQVHFHMNWQERAGFSLL